MRYGPVPIANEREFSPRRFRRLLTALVAIEGFACSGLEDAYPSGLQYMQAVCVVF